MSRNAFIDPQRRLIAFWSPKCGCTTVARWFIDTVLERTADFRTSGLTSGTWLAENGFTHAHTDAYRRAATGAYRTVLFTRDPATRIASAFINKFYFRAKTPLDTRAALEPFASEFLTSLGPNGGADDHDYRGISFREFIAAVHHAKRRGLPLDHHWDSQFPVCLDESLVYPDPGHLVRLESFNADLAAVHAALGIDHVPIAALNRTRYPDDFVGLTGFLGDRRTVEMLGERIALRTENLYDAELKLLIREIYGLDYERLSYAPPSRAA